MPVYKDNAVNRRLNRVGKEYGKIDRSKPPPPPPGPPPKKKRKSQKPPPPPPGPPPKKKQEKKIKKKHKNTPQYQRLLDRSKARKAKKKPGKDAFEGLNDSDFDDIMPKKPTPPKKKPQKAVKILPKKRQVNVPIRKVVAPKAFPTTVLLDKLNEDVRLSRYEYETSVRKVAETLKKKYPKKADVVAFVKSKNYPKKLQREPMYYILRVLAMEEVLATPIGKEYTRITKIRDDALEERDAAEKARDPNKLYYGEYLPPIPYHALGKAGMRDEHKANPKLQQWAKKQLNDNPTLYHPKQYTPNPFEGQERPEDDFDRLAKDLGRSRTDVIRGVWNDMEKTRQRQMRVAQMGDRYSWAYDPTND
tara:strand:- start:39 stop:1124 length:1086 start_codon:yes stop_codon:yes gene_type:complete